MTYLLQLCDELNLLHISRGDGAKRFIEVKKKKLVESPRKQVAMEISLKGDKHEASIDNEHKNEPLTTDAACCGDKEVDPLRTIRFRVKREVLQQLVNSKGEKGKANSLEVLLTENHSQNLDR